MFNEDQMRLLVEFYHHCYFFTPEQEEQSANWNQSYYQYELMQGLILGENYRNGYSPPWLKDHPKYREGPILTHIAIKKKTFKTLQKIKHYANNLLICEIGYGTDLIIAMMVKEWKHILCYDHNPYMEQGLIEFFVNSHDLRLDFIRSPSSVFDFKGIKEKTIVISNQAHVPVKAQHENIRSNKNLIYVCNGEVLKKIPSTVEECREQLKRGYL